MTPVALLILNANDIRSLLSVKDCIPLMRQAMEQRDIGLVYQPLRTIIAAPEAKGMLGMMPAYTQSPKGDYYGAKIGSFFPMNSRIGLDPHQGGVLLFSGETGELLAVMNAAEITGIRTAAMSGLATDLLARKNAQRATLVGAGHQAGWQLAALAAVRPLTEVTVVSQNFKNAQEFVRQQQANYAFELKAEKDLRVAVAKADIITTVTNAKMPFLEADWVQAGTHINAVGSSTKTHSEIYPELMAKSLLFADSIESIQNESGDYINALQAQLVTAADLQGEIGQLITGKKPGRPNDEAITLFKSLGMALEDVATASALYELAQQQKKGLWAEF